MSYSYKWRPSKTAKREFAKKMDEIDEFCLANCISSSKSNDSYYFNINGQNYRISNHSVESRNKYDIITGQLINSRGYALDDKREEDVIYIHAGKTRIIEIYNNLKNGIKLNGRGEKV